MAAIARFLTFAALLALSLGSLRAQTPVDNGQLDDAQALKLYERTLQLMEAGGIFMPDLNQAAKPLVENSRQTLESLRLWVSESSRSCTTAGSPRCAPTCSLPIRCRSRFPSLRSLAASSPNCATW